MRAFVLFSTILFFGCGMIRSRDRCGKYQIRERWILYLWVQDDPEIPKESVLTGCNFWNTVGVTCVLTGERQFSRVQIYVKHGKCTRGKAGIIIGQAYPGGRIDLFPDCMSHDDATLIAISAHEVGHQLGVGHTDQEYSSVMSPALDRSHECLLEADIEAWNRRSWLRSVLSNRIRPSVRPWCELPNQM